MVRTRLFPNPPGNEATPNRGILWGGWSNDTRPGAPQLQLFSFGFVIGYGFVFIVGFGYEYEYEYEYGYGP